MNVAFANTLAADMVNRLRYAPDFFETALEYETIRLSDKEEYLYALRSAMASRIPMESEDWRLQAVAFLKKKEET